MCGIVGIYAYHYAANAIDRVEVRRIRDHMATRVPDGVGGWFSQDERVSLGHCWLAIVDLSESAAQPMSSAGPSAGKGRPRTGAISSAPRSSRKSGENRLRGADGTLDDCDIRRVSI
jgi:hypothetical protein